MPFTKGVHKHFKITFYGLHQRSCMFLTYFSRKKTSISKLFELQKCEQKNVFKHNIKEFQKPYLINFKGISPSRKLAWTFRCADKEARKLSCKRDTTFRIWPKERFIAFKLFTARSDLREGVRRVNPAVIFVFFPHTHTHKKDIAPKVVTSLAQGKTQRFFYCASRAEGSP